jgi:hypothetical protein
MKSLKFRYILQMAIVVAIILFAGGQQLPKYVSRLSVIAALAVVDMLYWLSVRKSISTGYRKVLTIAYWFPLWYLLLFFVAGFVMPYNQWPSLLHIYLPGILLILLIGKGIFLSMLVVGDIFIIPLNLIKGIDPENEGRAGGWYRPRSFLLTSGGIATAVMLIFISGMFFWVADYKLVTVEIPVRNLPKEFDGYKIAQISDMHLGSFFTARPLNKIVAMVNGQHADAVVFTGDMVNFSTDEALAYEEEMKTFSAPDGIFSVLGNHDYGEYSQWDSPEAKQLNDKALFEFYDRIGWHLLRNQNAVIHRDSASIAIIGVENWSLNKRFGKKGNIRKAMAGAESAQFKILLSHDPSHWDGEVNSKYPQIGLTLSGHTHAFQIAVEIGSVKWSPATFLYKQWGGLYEKTHPQGGKQYLYVNRGAGTLGYPGRILSQPEITLLILRRAG